jgi:hypothetical protein
MEHDALALERNIQSPESCAEDLSTQRSVAVDAANFVLLPFLESPVNASKVQSRQSLPCWQRQAVSHHKTTNNYPSIDSAFVSSEPVIVPLDPTVMSLGVKRNRRWECIS